MLHTAYSDAMRLCQNQRLREGWQSGSHTAGCCSLQSGASCGKMHTSGFKVLATHQRKKTYL